MARIVKTKRSNNVAFYLVQDNHRGKQSWLYLGTEPPWPKTQGWTGLTERQLASIDRILERKQAIKHHKPTPPSGHYRTIVIDPPWPTPWPKRLSRPNQLGLPYKTMTIEEIRKLPIKRLAMVDGCHIYLWTTHGLLPMAFQLFKHWGVEYKCLLTWVKNVGFTPYSFMLSTEFCLFGQIGKMRLLKLGKKVAFEAKVTNHSRKPAKFYKLVQLVSPEPRLDMFSREGHKGFTSWGDEPQHFVSN